MNKAWGGAVRADHVGKPMGDRFDSMPSRREMKIYACDLLYGREGASKLLGLSVNTVRNASKHVRMYYGGQSNTATAIELGWLAVPDEYLA